MARVEDPASGEAPLPNPVGRPTVYSEDYPRQALALCKLGAKDVDLADFFDVSVRTIERWQAIHPEFCRALKVGKAPADDKVERSLYHRATGYTYLEQQAIKVKQYNEEGKQIEDVKLVEVERHQPPDTTAMIFWLKNRRKEKWRDKHEFDHNHTITLSEQFEDFIRSLKPGEGAKVIEHDGNFQRGDG
jgi:phage terminase Nu1 subunit (DNA packaging protein)